MSRWMDFSISKTLKQTIDLKVEMTFIPFFFVLQTAGKFFIVFKSRMSIGALIAVVHVVILVFMLRSEIKSFKRVIVYKPVEREV